MYYIFIKLSTIVLDFIMKIKFVSITLEIKLPDGSK